jgi:double-stranded uracil-DNA glycosylase
MIGRRSTRHHRLGCRASRVGCGVLRDQSGIPLRGRRRPFANPRNDFWRLLADAGLTPGQLGPEDQWKLLELGFGLTNAAYRTTKGSSDLRRGDFAGSAERLEQIARELRPRTIAFVGKAAYEGAFRERPALGRQERRLEDTTLFVLPSTSPANAAVPYEERLRWFRELAEISKKT